MFFEKTRQQNLELIAYVFTCGHEFSDFGSVGRNLGSLGKRIRFCFARETLLLFLTVVATKVPTDKSNRDVLCETADGIGLVGVSRSIPSCHSSAAQHEATTRELYLVAPRTASLPTMTTGPCGYAIVTYPCLEWTIAAPLEAVHTGVFLFAN